MNPIIGALGHAVQRADASHSRVQYNAGVYSRPQPMLLFKMIDNDTITLIHDSRFGADLRFKLVDHFLIIKALSLAHAIFVKTALVMTTGYANGRNQRFTRPVDYTADNGDIHRGDQIFKALFQGIYRAYHIKLLPRTGWAGNEVNAASTNAQ